MHFFFQGIRTKTSLLSHAGHSFLGCILQVGGRSNGESAVTENVLGLMDIGSWKGVGGWCTVTEMELEVVPQEVSYNLKSWDARVS